MAAARTGLLAAPCGRGPVVPDRGLGPVRAGADHGRGVVSGHDWTHLDLRERYGDHWVPALLSRIQGAR
ncbi:hypothetical protein M1L60_03935 [Actinoplanes sp. TRM 88003]|uniref:Uncharacterized protein n=1 Tax=Paractinoplanes aksuensis TaxID=2939490 RepID=A0ABT1DI43_9ACTN|nr:hypothetical protein [Actinoplanes aksuensis]MCO8269740.1 hypothetical protein [Actinoplanes aksuensis]